MRFFRRVLRDAVGLLVAAPVDLMLAVAALFVVGALLALSGSTPFVGVAFDFLASTLLASSLVAGPVPDGLAASASRLGRRFAPALGQALAVIALIVGLIVVVGVVITVVLLVAAPGFAERIDDAVRDPQTAARDPGVALLGLVFVLGLLIVTGRLLPSTGLVLDRPVGVMESLRLSWASTRRRTLACAAVLLVVTAPSWLLAAFLPLTLGAFVSILSYVFTVAVGVAAYRALFAEDRGRSGG